VLLASGATRRHTAVLVNYIPTIQRCLFWSLNEVCFKSPLQLNGVCVCVCVWGGIHPLTQYNSGHCRHTPPFPVLCQSLPLPPPCWGVGDKERWTTCHAVAFWPFSCDLSNVGASDGARPLVPERTCLFVLFIFRAEIGFHRFIWINE